MIDERSALLPPLTPTTPARRKVPEAVDVKQRQGSAASAFFVRHNPYYTGPTPGLDALEAEDTLMRPTSLPRRQVIGNQSLLPESTFDDLLLGGYGDQLTPVTSRSRSPKVESHPQPTLPLGPPPSRRRWPITLRSCVQRGEWLRSWLWRRRGDCPRPAQLG